jgi:TrpR family trp operon transcriptional repressor
MKRGSSETEVDGAAMLAEIFAGIRSRRRMRRFLEEILTPAELCDLVLRWRLLQRLHAGVPQRRIAEELRVSLCKITRGSRILKRPGAVTAGILHAKAGGEQSRQRTTVDSKQ